MTLLIAPADLAGLYAGTPALLVLEGVEALETLASPGLALWLVGDAAGTGPMRLSRPGKMARGVPGTTPHSAPMPVPVPVPPAGVLAVIAPDAGAVAPLLAWWAMAGPEVPPLIEAANAEAALPALARLALAALGTQAGTAAALHRGLAAARQDAEESREAMVSLIRHSTRGTPPPALTQVLSLLPSAGGQVVQAVEGRLAAGQRLGLPLEGLAALALHLEEAHVGPAALLRVRLYGAESGRTHGAWLIPGEALVPGWLALDLPTPIGPLRETACLELVAELEQGDILAIALEDRPTGPAQAVAVRQEQTQPAAAPDRVEDRALALRVWTAPFGRRFVVPQHWDAEAAGLAVALPGLPAGAPTGVPVRLPAQLWDTAQFPAGQVEWVALGTEAPRLLASFGAGRRVAIVLPDVPVNGLDLLQAEVAVGRGDPARLEAALWLQPEGAPVTTEGDLSLATPEARWSGWRSPQPHGGGGGGPLLLPLALPLHRPRSVTVVLVLRHNGAAPGQPLRVEWSDLVGFRTLCPPPPMVARNPLPAPPSPEPIPTPPRRVAAAGPAATRLQPPPASPSPAPTEPTGQSGPGVVTVRLQEHYVTPDGGYRHLDIVLEGVRDGSLSWPRLRFKLAQRGEGPMLEFRRRQDWPAMFTTWPGTEADAWGPYLLVCEADLAGDFLDRLPQEQDRRLLAALVRLLPKAVAEAAREAPAAAADAELWLRHARQLAGALREAVG